MLGRVLARLKTCDFAAEAAGAGCLEHVAARRALYPSATVADLTNQSRSGGHLALLERILDIYEPVVVKRLKDLSGLVREMLVQVRKERALV